MSGPQHAITEQRCKSGGDLNVQIVAALGGVGGRLEVEITLGIQFPDGSHAFVQFFESSRLRHRSRQIVEPLGEVLDRSGIVDQATAGPGRLRPAVRCSSWSGSGSGIP